HRRRAGEHAHAVVGAVDIMDVFGPADPPAARDVVPASGEGLLELLGAGAAEADGGVAPEVAGLALGLAVAVHVAHGVHRAAAGDARRGAADHAADGLSRHLRADVPYVAHDPRTGVVGADVQPARAADLVVDDEHLAVVTVPRPPSELALPRRHRME